MVTFNLKWNCCNAKTIRIERTVQRIRTNNKANRTELIVSAPKSQSSVRTIPLPDPRTMQYRFKALLASAGLRKLNFHSLRHMFATNCVELGFDVKTLSELLGHSSVEITLNRYVHSSMERKRQCMDMLSLDVA